MSRLTMAVVTALIAAGTASAQVATLQNASFEDANGCDSTRPAGWAPFNTAVWRTVANGLDPAIPRTGTAVIELPGGDNFVAYTSEWRLITDEVVMMNPNICLDPIAQLAIPYNRPQYTFQPALDGIVGPGNFEGPCPVRDPEPVQAEGPSIRVAGYYMIPAADPFIGHRAGFKLEFRRTPPNNSIYEAFENLGIDGTVPGGVHTNGVWTRFEWVFRQNQFRDPLHGCPPENPATVSLLVLRFGDAPGAGGTIFWDDISFEQESPCPADFNNSGSVTPQDIFDFLAAFFTPGSLAADFNHSGAVTPQDIFDFLAAFFTPCV